MNLSTKFDNDNYGNMGYQVLKWGTKLERFLHKNPKEIIEFWELASCQKLGIKLFENWCYQKKSIAKNVLLNWCSSMKKEYNDVLT